jgi:signal transduction histidine kinase
MQLVFVTAAAVALSNLTVAIWFELGSARLNERALMDRVIDRAASTATLMAAIEPSKREAAARTMTAGAWEFSVHTGDLIPNPMTAEEARLAAHLRASLGPERTKYPVSVKFGNVPADVREPRARIGPPVQFVVPIDRASHLVATFYRPTISAWPIEVMAAALMAIVVASAAAAYFARRVTRPLSQLASAASAVAEGQQAPRLEEAGPQDVRNAAIAFNAMTDQVSRTLESQRHLLSAVGHDLRTPITAMRISLEFVEDEELRGRLQNGLDELQALTESVLSAARGAGGETKRSVDLAALVDSLCADLDDLGEPVNWKPHPPAPVSCRPNEIRRAVRNLVENAVSYGKRASVQIAEKEHCYEVLVDDEGPGIPEPEQRRVFEPFVRLEGSRNQATGGSGLGLTLVKAIAEGHGGSVTLENLAAGGLRARLRLPRGAAFH